MNGPLFAQAPGWAARHAAWQRLHTAVEGDSAAAGALRAVLGRHFPDRADPEMACPEDGDRWPCGTTRDIAEPFGIDLEEDQPMEGTHPT